MAIDSNLKLALLTAVTSVTLAVAVSSAVYFVVDFLGNGNRKKKKPNQKIVPGLYNFGNTCFANALLQSLASCPSFESWLSNVTSLIPEKSTLLLSELRAIIQNLNHASDDCSVSADGILYALRAHRWSITPDIEQDLFELFNVFITTWDEELTPYLNGKTFTLADVEGLEKLSSNSHAGNRLRGISEIVQAQHLYRAPCVGLLGTELGCQSCGFKTVRHDRFCSLDLVLPKTTSFTEISIEMCLRKYFAQEMLPNFKCEKCEQNRLNLASPLKKCSFVKKQGISKLPDCLILRVQRVGISPNGAAFKHLDHVKFKETLLLDEFMFYQTRGMKTRDTEKMAGGDYVVKGGADGERNVHSNLHSKPFIIMNNRCSYILRSVVVHIGRPESGHFVTYRRAWTPSSAIQTQRTQWYYTSDTEVKRVSFETVAKQEAYMLFYEKIPSTKMVT